MPFEPRQRIVEAFLAGYRLVRPAIDDWLDTLPRFIRFMGIFKFARVLHALAPADPAFDPPWLAHLRSKLTRRLDGWRAQFAELR